MRRLTCFVLTVLAALSARADTLISNSGGSGFTSTTHWGQSFLLPTGFDYSITAIDLPYTSNGHKIYVFDQLYADTSANLASATTGLVATLTFAGGEYTFATPLTATGGNTYYFYGSGFQADGASQAGGGYYSGGTAFLASNGSSTFTASPNLDLHFSVLGTATPTAVPEPSTYAALAGLGALGFACWHRRKNRSSGA